MCYKKNVIYHKGVIRLKDYEINERTLAVIAQGDEAKVFEEDNCFMIPKTTNTIMEESCEYFGSSLEGRQKGTNSLIGIRHKAPVIIEETKEIIFFPTSSPRLNNCHWISLNNLDSYKQVGGKIKLKFNNHKEIFLDVSYGIIDNQVLRATRLESALRKRKKNTKIV